MLSGDTLPRIMACNVALAQLGTISVYTFPLRCRMPKTGVLAPAPRPRFPLMRLAPKYDSSTSISPSKGECYSQYSAILFRRRNKYRLTVLRFKLVKMAMFLADKSREK